MIDEAQAEAPHLEFYLLPIHGPHRNVIERPRKLLRRRVLLPRLKPENIGGFSE
jgi:hypothetical protein